MKKAKATLDRFLKAWVEGNYPKMYKYSQVTWKHSSSKRNLDSRFRPLKISDFRIGEFQQVSEAMYKFQVQVKTDRGWSEMEEVNVICEEAPYQPKVSGVWGVNPVSVLKTINPASYGN